MRSEYKMILQPRTWFPLCSGKLPAKSSKNTEWKSVLNITFYVFWVLILSTPAAIATAHCCITASIKDSSHPFNIILSILPWSCCPQFLAISGGCSAKASLTAKVALPALSQPPSQRFLSLQAFCTRCLTFSSTYRIKPRMVKSANGWWKCECHLRANCWEEILIIWKSRHAASCQSGLLKGFVI